MPRDDEFQVVTRRKRANRLPRGLHRLAERAKEEPEIDIDQVARHIQKAVEEIANSGYGNILLDGLEEGLKLIKASAVREIVCYGLGNFSESRASKFQLAAILAIKSRYESKVHLYDPLFFRQEIQLLKKLGLDPIESNEEAKRLVGESTSLVYLPHCPYQLTNNFIYANWTAERLANCIVLSNSFKELAESIFLKKLEESGNFLAKINLYTTEIPLENSFRYDDIFNGSSIHVFLAENLTKVPENFWNLPEEPNYQEENCEFVRKSLKE